MTTIYCSSKASRLLGITRFEVGLETGDIFGKWNCHLFYINRKKCLILVNKQTLYSILIIDFRVSEFKEFQDIIFSTLVLQLSSDMIFTPERSALFKTHFTGILFSTTDNDRPIIGSMNEFILQFTATYENGSPAAKAYKKGFVATFLNEMPMGKLNFDSPKERLNNLFVNSGL